MRTFISDLKNFVGEKVTLKGWAYNVRSSGKIKFLLLRDGTGLCQCVFFKGGCTEEAFNNFEQITQETSVFVTGTVKADPRQPGGYELSAESFEIYGKSVDYPITPKDHGTDFLMNNRHLWLRSKRQVAIMKIRHTIVKAIRDFFDNDGFTLMDSPIFTPNACEGTSTLFETNYFDLKAYLSQSGQLYGEASAAALGKAYVFGPTFRAEKSKTRRHLIEFWMVEPEVAFNDLYDNMELAERFVEYVVQTVVKTNPEELKTLERDIEKLKKITAPFPRIHYKEAVKIIKAENPDFIDGDDFGAPDEAIVSAKYEKPVFVHHFPTAIKAFYMKEDPNEPGYTMSCDLIAPDGFGEIIGGGQREESYDTLVRKIEEHKLNQSDFEWYLDLRKYGTFPHSGFGLGVERAVAWICGLPHIRESIPYPRMYGRIYP